MQRGDARHGVGSLRSPRRWLLGFFKLKVCICMKSAWNIFLVFSSCFSMMRLVRGSLKSFSTDSLKLLVFLLSTSCLDCLKRSNDLFNFFNFFTPPFKIWLQCELVAAPTTRMIERLHVTCTSLCTDVNRTWGARRCRHVQFDYFRTLWKWNEWTKWDFCEQWTIAIVEEWLVLHDKSFF